jgi:hypothetical protein
LYLRISSGEVYRYFDDPAALAQQFLAAESRGRYLSNVIRDHIRYERLAKLNVA